MLISNYKLFFQEYRGVLHAPILLLIFFSLIGCSSDFVRNKEAREDQKELEACVKFQKQVSKSFKAIVQTDPVSTFSADDDAADDPAIWINHKQLDQSVVFGSNKKLGIHSYDLSGKEIQFIKAGKINNIDIRQGIPFKMKVDLIGATNRTDHTIDFFIIDSIGRIEQKPSYRIKLDHFDPYGFCLGQIYSDRLSAFVNYKSGLVEHFSLKMNYQGFSHKLEHKFKFQTQLEGMAVDDRNKILYLGEEQKGIYSIDLSNKNPTPTLFTASTDDNPFIRYDIEGITILNDSTLIASIQGNFSYAAFDRLSHEYIGSFKIVSGQFDAVEETDGIDLVQDSLNMTFPAGVFVVQDGFNYLEQELQNQNFKYLDLGPISEYIDSLR